MAASKFGGGSPSTSSGSSRDGGSGGFKSLLPNSRLFKAIGLGILLIALPMVCFNSKSPQSNPLYERGNKSPEKSPEKEPPVSVSVIYPGEGKITLLTGTVYKIKLDPGKWSPWLCRFPEASVRISAPGWIQYWFWSEPKPEGVVPDNSIEWYKGNLRRSIFRVRGAEGEATLHLEYE